MKNNFTIMGFESLADFATTFFGLAHFKTNLVVIGIAATTSFITGYIYDDHIAVYVLWALYMADFFSGIAAALYTGTLRSARLPRILVNIVGMTMLLSMTWWMAKGSEIFYLLPALVVGGAYSTLFISLIENLSKLEILPPGIQRIVQRRFGLGGIEKKLFGDDPIDETQNK